MSGEQLDLAQVVREALQAQGVAQDDGLVELVDGPALRIFGGPRMRDRVEPFLLCSVYGNGTPRVVYGGTTAPQLDGPAFDVRGRVLTAVHGVVIGRGPYAPLQTGPAD